jgi:hypothetical protein
VWVVLAWQVAKEHPTVHQARTVAADAGPPPLASAVRAWLDREASGTARRVPMLLVAASGGGAKAAYWTDLVLDCLLGAGEPAGGPGGECPPAPGADRIGRVFLTSSVSGGSVGIHHLVRHRDAAEDWVDAAAGTEVLSPAVAWALLHDLPAFMLGAPADPRRCVDRWSCLWHADRALVQEAAVARFADGVVPPPGLGVLAARRDGAPVTVFNAALDGADGRVLISPVALAPPRPSNATCPTIATGEPAAGSVDGHDVLNVQHEVGGAGGARRFEAVAPFRDVPLVTAAVLSARFPVVAPAARLGDADPTRASCTVVPPTHPPVQLRDGGYVENSGVLTIVELLPAIRRAVRAWKRDHHRRDLDVPLVVVSIDDDPEVADADPALEEAPRQDLGIQKRAGPSYLTRMARDRLQSCQYANVHYVRISPVAHAGAQAATGWEISRTVREEDLAASLAERRPAGRQLAALRTLLATGAGEIRCPRGRTDATATRGGRPPSGQSEGARPSG